MKRIITSTVALAGLATLGLGGTTASAQTAPATPVTTANLPTTPQLSTSSTEHYVVTATATNTGAKVTPCQISSLKAYSPNRVITRTYSSKGNPIAQAQVASFASHARAVAVAQAEAGSLKGCAARLVKANPDLTSNFTEYTRNVKLPSGQVMYLHAMNMHDGESGRNFIIEDGVVATGTHVEYLSIAHGDTNGSLDTRNIQKVLAGTVSTLAR